MCLETSLEIYFLNNFLIKYNRKKNTFTTYFLSLV